MRTSLATLLLGLLATAPSPQGDHWFEDWGIEHPEAFHDGPYSPPWVLVQIPAELHPPSVALDDSLRILWDGSQIETPERGPAFAVLRGHVQYLSERAPEPVAPPWPLGLLVALAHQPATPLDWSQGVNTQDSASAIAFVLRDGSFEARIPARQFHRVVGGSGAYQLGASLATFRPDRVVFDRRTPVLSESLSSVELAGPAPLSETQQLLVSVGNVEFTYMRPLGSHRPIALVRAVNHLHALGREAALRELELFAATAADDREFGTYRRGLDSTQIDSAHLGSLFSLVRLLFVPIDTGPGSSYPVKYPDGAPAGSFSTAAGGYPRIDIGEIHPQMPPAVHAAHPSHPLVESGGVPFSLIGSLTLGGVPQSSLDHLFWARHHARLREAPITPTLDPVAAVESLCAELEQLGSESSVHDLIRGQAWRSIRLLVTQPDGSRFRSSRHGWARARELSAAGRLRWDAEAADFILVDE